jgi:hypothetical protein
MTRDVVTYSIWTERLRCRNGEISWAKSYSSVEHARGTRLRAGLLAHSSSRSGIV